MAGSYNGKRVSGEWQVILEEARDQGVRFTLNSGNRTIAEQKRLRAAYLRRLAGGPWAPLAAVPSCSAPHIRCNRIDHAIDVDALDGGAGRLAAWLRRQGVNPRFTVPGEPWHIELTAAELRRLSARFSADPYRFLTPTEKRWAKEYDRLKAQRRDEPRRRSLRNAMKVSRKRIWRYAQPKKKGGDGKGWTRSRRARYKALMDRTQ